MAGGNNNTLNAVRGITQGNAGGQGIRGIVANPTTTAVPAGVRAPNSSATTVTASSTPPPKASAAPSGVTKYTSVGLCEALNAYEQQLVSSGTVEQANIYEIQFAPDSLKNAKLKISGTTNKNMTPNQDNITASAKINPNQNSVNYNGLNRSISHGTQIVQFIETIMRNSTFITDQQLYKIDSETGETIPNTSVTGSGQTQWFKIILNAWPVSNVIDKKRNDFAYHMTYIITTYGINQAESQFFPDSNFRGVHKVFNYWFTGLNTEILHYEQKFDNLYRNIIADSVPELIQTGLDPALGTALQFQNKRMPATRTGQNDQGATFGANNPASSLADFLYSQGDQTQVIIKVVGDPAFILQGEVTGLTSGTVNFQGFYPDGTINPDVQEAVFVINWNNPADYNIDTGLMDINTAGQQLFGTNLASAPTQQSAAYRLLNIKSTFSKGEFTQELDGRLITNLGQQQLSRLTTDSSRSSTASNTGTAAQNQPQSGIRIPNLQTISNDASALLAPITTNSLTSGLNPSLWTSGVNSILPATGINSSVISLGAPQPGNPSQLPSSNGISLGPINISNNAIIQNLPGGATAVAKAAVVSAFNNFNNKSISTVPPNSNTYSPSQTDASIQVYRDTQTQVNTESQIMAPPEDASASDSVSDLGN